MTPRPAPLMIPSAGAAGGEAQPMSPRSSNHHKLTNAQRTLFSICSDSALRQHEQRLAEQEAAAAAAAAAASQPAPTNTARACVEQWLGVMEVCSRKSCASSTSGSVCSFASLDSCASMLSGTAGSLSSLAGSMPAQLDQHMMEDDAGLGCLPEGCLFGPSDSLADSLPPPAFVVLGLLSAS